MTRHTEKDIAFSRPLGETKVNVQRAGYERGRSFMGQAIKWQPGRSETQDGQHDTGSPRLWTERSAHYRSQYTQSGCVLGYWWLCALHRI